MIVTILKNNKFKTIFSHKSFIRVENYRVEKLAITCLGCLTDSLLLSGSGQVGKENRRLFRQIWE